LRLTKEEAWVKESIDGMDLLRTGDKNFCDDVFANDVARCIRDCKGEIGCK
jgi:hypothetical protein